MEYTNDKIELTEYIVIVIDLCSSSVILENLEQSNKLIVWREFWAGVVKFIKENETFEKVNLYKFTGDGFILILRSGEWENAIKICNDIVHYVDKQVKQLLTIHLSATIPRIGITIGIDCGELLEFEIDGKKEYTGITINIASRLQALLKGKKDANKAMISNRVKNKLAKLGTVKRLRPVMSVLRNIFKNASILCHEVDLSIIDRNSSAT